jgi:hypothetical protein
MLVCSYLSTVEWGPTLSAVRKVRAKSGDFAAYGSRSVEKRMSMNDVFRCGVVSTHEIAQFQLGDLNFHHHLICLYLVLNGSPNAHFSLIQYHRPAIWKSIHS